MICLDLFTFCFYLFLQHLKKGKIIMVVVAMWLFFGGIARDDVYFLTASKFLPRFADGQNAFPPIPF